MSVSVDMTFRDMSPNDALRGLCEEHVEKLGRSVPELQRVEVVLANPHHHSEHNHTVYVTVKAHVPGGANLVVNQHSDDPKFQQADVAIREAFRSLERQVRAWSDKKHNKVKRRDP